MDEPMTMRNVPQEHQGRFLSDMQILMLPLRSSRPGIILALMVTAIWIWTLRAISTATT